MPLTTIHPMNRYEIYLRGDRVYTRICKRCGAVFKTASPRQSYCHQELILTCDVCGKEFTHRCDDTTPTACSRKCASKHPSKSIGFRKCLGCGAIFKPRSSNHIYCGKELNLICETCGKSFKTKCGPQTPKNCSKTCGGRYSYQQGRKCDKCGKFFIPTNFRQHYCNEKIEVECAVCGKQFQSTCNAYTPITCSSRCASKHHTVAKKCIQCGEEFVPKSSDQKYCNQPKKKICSICNQEFEYICNGESKNQRDTCWSKSCIDYHKAQVNASHYQEVKKRCIICGDEFTPCNNTQSICDKEYHEFICEICGKPFLLDRDYLVRSNLNDIRRTCSDECRSMLQSDHCVFRNKEVQEKIKQTCLKAYGVPYPAQSEQVRKRMWESYQSRTGYSHPSHNPESRKRSAKKRRNSSLEERIKSLFTNYNVDFIHHYVIQDVESSIAHEFDFYLPAYKLLIDADGVYFHSYLSDPDGKQCIDYYDDIRLKVVPADHTFHIIVEGTEDQRIKQIVEILNKIDEGIFNYDSYLFNWCRSIDFPYPNYTNKRLISDWTSLCKYQNVKYIPQCRIGESIIKQYHRSIYSCHRGRGISPLEAWYDDDKLKAVIKNRLIYVNDIDPSKILRGFNISKICPVVSIFNPILAKYLILKYLNDFNTIFDPFSGFSGRMLGAASLGKMYIGQDLNSTAVQESNEIIKFLNLGDRCSVSIQDVFQSSGEYDCLLTCPPYGTKEIYGDETIFKSCDEWIDECLSRFKCKRYVFVVDETSKCSQFVKEDIKSTSHFSDVIEKVIVIEP